MLVGLDTIEWSTLTHADIPQMLRDMETADDESFEDIFDDFFDAVRHQRSVYDVTPFVIPFLIQLIALTDDDVRKTQYLFFLTDLAEDSKSPQHNFQSEEYPKEFQIYDELERSSSCFFDLASHHDLDIQVLSLYTLAYISSLQPRVTPLLKQAVNSSNDTFIQMALISSYERSLSSVPLSEEYEAGLEQLLAWATSERPFLARVTASQSYISLSKYDPQLLLALPEVILNLLVQSFEVDIFELAHEAGDESAFSYPRALMALVPFLSDMALIDDNHTLLWLLVVEKSRMTPETSFISIRHLLKGVFNIFTDESEEGLLPETVLVRQTTYKPKRDGRQESASPSVMYEYYPRATHGHVDEFYYFYSGSDDRIISVRTLAHHKPGEPFTDLQRQALNAILGCDGFWQVETNLLSFFYGLPDDREELRALLTAESPQ